MRKSGMRLSGDWESFSPIRMKESKGRSGGPGRNEEMKKAVVCEKEERKRQRKAALCNLRAKKRWKFWEKRLWILFWLAILRNARTAMASPILILIGKYYYSRRNEQPLANSIPGHSVIFHRA